MSKPYVAIVSGQSLVGREIRSLLSERHFPAQVRLIGADVEDHIINGEGNIGHLHLEQVGAVTGIESRVDVAIHHVPVAVPQQGGARAVKGPTVAAILEEECRRAPLIANQRPRRLQPAPPGH